MESRQPAPNSACSSGCAKAAGFGCLGIVVIYFLISLSFIGGSSGLGGFVLSAIVGIVILLVVRQNKRNKIGSVSLPMQASPQSPPPQAAAPYTSAAYATTTNRFEVPTPSGLDGEFVQSPLCHHTFPKVSLEKNEPLTCGCGFSVLPADLIELDSIKQQMAALEARRATLLDRMRFGGVHMPKPVGGESDSAAVAASQRAVAKPKVAKPRRAISTQQWLVIGASILIFVAGMVFVSTNLNRLPQWAFQAITGGIAVLTALGSVYMRKISSLLASFFTAFSAAMQLAFMSILGDQLNENFEWNTAPAWWWLIALGVVAVVAGTMAKVTRIFGWKALALLATVAAALVLTLGVLLQTFVANASTVHIAILSVTAVATLWLAKLLRAIPVIIETEESLQDYARDLGEREDASLRMFAVGAAALQLAVGVGIFAIQYIPAATTALQPLPLLAIAAVWIAVAVSASRWSGQLKQDGSQLTEIASIARYVIQVALGLAVVSASLLLGNIWISLAIALPALLGVNLLSNAYPPIRPNPVTTLSVFSAASVAWALWTSPLPEYVDAIEATPAFVAGSAIAVALSELWFRVSRFAWVTGIGFSGALIWFASLYSQRFDDRLGWAFAALTLVLLVVSSLSIPLRAMVAKRSGVKTPTGFEWVGLATASVVAIVQLALVSSTGESPNIVELVPLVVVLLSYSTLALAIGAFTKFGANHRWLLQGHSYLGQLALLLLMLAAAATEVEGQNAIFAGLLLGLAALNYGYGWMRRQIVSLQLGFGYVITSIIPLQSIGDLRDIVALTLASILVITSVAFAHEFALRKLTKASTGLIQTSMLVGLALGLVLVLAVQWTSWNVSTLTQQLLVQSLLWGIGLITAAWNWVATRREKPVASSAWWVALIYVLYAAVFGTLPGATSNPTQGQWQWMLSALMIGLTVAVNYRSRPLPWLMPFALLANLIAGWWTGHIVIQQFGIDMIPEPYTVSMAIGLVGTTLLLGGRVFGLRNRLLLDIPVLGIAMGSFWYALWLNSPELNESIVRGILSLALIAGFSYWRSGREFPVAWISAGYLAGAGSSLYLTQGFALWTGWDYDGPEPLSLLLAVSVGIGNLIAVRRLGDRLVETRTILMLAVLTLPTLFYSLTVAQDFVDARLRQILTLAVMSGVAFWKLNRGRSLFWAIPGYVAAAGSMFAVADLLRQRVWTDFSGPELYSLPILLAVLVGHAFFLPRVTLRSSWVTWGIPMGVGVLPSAFETAVSASTAFAELSALQIGRVILVLTLSTALLVFGVRLGNLANTTVGLVGLSLILVPNTALQSGQVLPGAQVESTALVIGVLAFVALAVAKRQGLLKGRSTIFIGIPVAIIMGPALVRSLIALANPSLTNIDWWRFGILLTAGLALLIVGALRELGGMFFPGLASVLLTALPYAFMQSKDQEWFLWVVLLIVATVMIWVALRLEKLRKLGRDSANWVRELK